MEEGNYENMKREEEGRNDVKENKFMSRRLKFENDLDGFRSHPPALVSQCQAPTLWHFLARTFRRLQPLLAWITLES
jgi:hypothetical protein